MGHWDTGTMGHRDNGTMGHQHNVWGYGAHLPQPCCDFYMIGDMVPFKDIYPYLNILILPVPSQHRAKDTILTTYQQQWEGLTWEKVEVL